MTRQLTLLSLLLFLGLFGIFFNKYNTFHQKQPHSSSLATQMKSGIFFRALTPLPQDLSFVTDEGETITSRYFLGSYHVFFFGYSTCPSFCPEITEKMSQVARALPKAYTPGTKASSQHAHPTFKFYFVSIDPDNDTPEQLHKFLSQFEAPITGLQSLDDSAFEMADYFRAHVSKARGADGHIAHSASLVILDPLGYNCGILTDLSDPKQAAFDLIALEKKLRAEVTSPQQAAFQ